MRLLLIIAVLSLTSCSTYKAYQKVAADPFVDARESILLAQKCLAVYPPKTDSVRVTVSTDSSQFNKTIADLLAANDSLANELDRQEEEVKDTSKPVQPYRVKRQDSLRIINAFLRTYKPPAVEKTIEKEKTSSDGPTIALLQAQIVACRADNSAALTSEEKAKGKLARKNETLGWVIAGGLLLSVIGYGLGRFTKT